METPHITGGELDGDDDKDADPVPAEKDLKYVAAADAVVEALRTDKGLTVETVNKYLPGILEGLANVQDIVPGAGPVLAALLRILPHQI